MATTHRTTPIYVGVIIAAVVIGAVVCALKVAARRRRRGAATKMTVLPPPAPVQYDLPQRLPQPNPNNPSANVRTSALVYAPPWHFAPSPSYYNANVPLSPQISQPPPPPTLSPPPAALQARPYQPLYQPQPYHSPPPAAAAAVPANRPVSGSSPPSPTHHRASSTLRPSSGPAAPSFPVPVPQISLPPPAHAVQAHPQEQERYSPSSPPGVSTSSPSVARTNQQQNNEQPPSSLSLMDRMREVQTLMLEIHRLEAQEGTTSAILTVNSMHDPGGSLGTGYGYGGAGAGGRGDGTDAESRWRRIEEMRRRVEELSDVDVDRGVRDGPGDSRDAGRVPELALSGALEGGSGTTGAEAEARNNSEGRSATPLGPPPAYAPSPP